GWSQFLRDDHTNEELAAQIIASDEYYQTRGGGTDQGFLNAVYEDVLCRPITAREFDDRGDDLSGGFNDRVDTVEGILDSGEAEDMRAIHSVRSFLGTNVTVDQADGLVDSGDDGDWVFA